MACKAIETLPFCALLLLGLAVPLAGLAGPVVPGNPVIVLSPFAGGEGLIRAAGGTVLLPTAGFPTGHAADPGFADRLRRLGAWAVIDLARAAPLCGLSPPSVTTSVR